MLFELGGKRKRLIQVIYVLLAGLMFIALVGFGIGGATSGGIFDALGIGGGSSSSDPQYSQQIDNANEALQQDPKDEKALLKLARYNFLEGQTSLETDDQGRVTLSQDSLDSYRAADRRLGAVPEDRSQAARRQRRRADAEGLLDLGGHGPGEPRVRRRRRLRVGEDRRRRPPEPRRLHRPRDLGLPLRQHEGRATRRSRRRSRRRPTRRPRSRSRRSSSRPSSSVSWSSRR